MPNMRRAISHKLQAWSESSHRKPLVIFGARQVGKTYAIKQLASDRYDSLAYIDFSGTPEQRPYSTLHSRQPSSCPSWRFFCIPSLTPIAH